ncbi:MlaA family lipoprotein [Comamonas composti]|uniref:MlaA family lipoprotein n=1 Tax=Comamonas composti TaxID=408558 RepID=UPI000417291D|nr:VacJ family lipoprotein [Comamonas composti]
MKASHNARYRSLLLGVALTSLLAGCATTTGEPNPRDPFESFNRGMYEFNDGLDKAVLKPVATAYKKVTPRVAREGVGNFFANLGDAWSFVNNLLQGEGEGAYNSIVRFSVNTVFGIGGLFDVATEAGIQRRKQDFGQTLGSWGVPSGPYLVLPLLGPSTVRDTAGLPVDWLGNPITAVGDVSVRNSMYALRYVDLRASLLGTTDLLDSVALDKYSLTRDVYLGFRKSGGSGGDGRLDDDYDDDSGRLPPDEDE